jgi:hypothetical protein
MFIAGGPFFTPQLRRSSIASACLGEDSTAGFRSLRSEIVRRAHVAINISLLWSKRIQQSHL